MAIFSLTQVPNTIPSCVLWLDANDPAGNHTQPANNSALSTWVDKSGTGNHATQATGSMQPLFKTNSQAGLPAIRFDGVNDWMACAKTLTVADHDIFMVQKILTGADKRSLYWYNGSNTGFYFNNDSTTADFPTPTLILSDLAASTDFYIAEHQRLSNAAALFKNSSSQASGTCNASNLVAYLTIAADYTGGAPGNNDICEILVYRRQLSAAERTKMYGYLKNKWGIA